MPKFAANLTTMFPELEPRGRFGAAAKAGFKAVEFLRPYEFKKTVVKSWLDENGLEFLLLNTQRVRVMLIVALELCRDVRRNLERLLIWH